ncbi:MAG: carboxypeptidase regulatory-like domain-containing protein [Candidatus Altiarchaeota archaeon]
MAEVRNSNLFGKRWFLLLAVAILLPAGVSSEYIYGYVTDKGTGSPFVNISVDVFMALDHSSPLASVRTDNKGYYNATVEPGNYDIYLRVGDSNPMQSVYVQAGQIQQIDFKINMKSISEQQQMDSYTYWIVFIIGGIILLIILADQIFFKRKRILSDLAAERSRLESELKGKEEAVDELGKLKKDKGQLEYMINLTRTKYHQRTINEESYREIIRDYQEKLIEVEAKIAAMEAEKKESK